MDTTFRETLVGSRFLLGALVSPSHSAFVSVSLPLSLSPSLSASLLYLTASWILSLPLSCSVLLLLIPLCTLVIFVSVRGDKHIGKNPAWVGRK